MVNRPVTIGTINDYMHERNGQKQEHPQKADPGGPKARGVVIWKLHVCKILYKTWW